MLMGPAELMMVMMMRKKNVAFVMWSFQEVRRPFFLG
jgi:hypothetical protein